MLLAYRLIAPFIVLLLVWAVVSAGLSVGRRVFFFVVIAGFLFALSPWLSYYNVIVWERSVRVLVPGVEWVVVMGVPIPVPRVGVDVEKQIVAVNVGGGLVPVVAGVLLLWAAAEAAGFWVLWVFLAGFTMVSLATYATSRAVPGVGIVVPGLVPPLVSSMIVVLLMGPGPAAGFVAYAAGSIGSLFGADVLRLLRDLDKLGAPFVSIGGVGVFDGVFLSGVFSLLLTL